MLLLAEELPADPAEEELAVVDASFDGFGRECGPLLLGGLSVELVVLVWRQNEPSLES
jgi:hypothetical protein